MAIHYYEQGVKSGLSGRKNLSQYLSTLIRSHLNRVKTVQLSYVFCSDDDLLTINNDFLSHDTYTDIITFDLSENERELQGEIYISVDRVKDNAAKYNTSYQEELHRVIFHGALHLCGFKDKTAKDKKEMRKQEDSCLKAYFNN